MPRNRAKTIRLARDDGDEGRYVFLREGEPIKHGGFWLSTLASIPRDQFEKMTNVILEPGEGPVELKLVRVKRND